MSKADPRRVTARPTPFEDLNLVLGELVARARAVLADNFVGAYLKGSFALGEGDQHSDVDLMIVTEHDVDRPALEALNAMHAAIFELASPWAQHLECSYAPKAILRRWATAPRDPPGEPRDQTWADPATGGSPARVYPFHFLGNGERALVRSEHDNTQVVRWVLREKGVALAGPPARSLIDPVSPEALRAEVGALLPIVASRMANEPEMTATHAVQGFMVLLTARMLHTLATGRVHSKRGAMIYARQHLEPRWADLVQRAFAGRASLLRGPAARQTSASLAADPAEAADTVAFTQAAVALEERRSAARAVMERRLAQARQGPPGHRSAQHDAGPRGPGRAGWSPQPIRPGGRGRRG